MVKLRTIGRRFTVTPHGDRRPDPVRVSVDVRPACTAVGQHSHAVQGRVNTRGTMTPPLKRPSALRSLAKIRIWWGQVSRDTRPHPRSRFLHVNNHIRCFLGGVILGSVFTHSARLAPTVPHFPAISCLGASRTPANRAPRNVRGGGVRERCTGPDMAGSAALAQADLISIGQSYRLLGRWPNVALGSGAAEQPLALKH
jgi:hypothetical protein